jgi:hypothetical protein
MHHMELSGRGGSMRKTIATIAATAIGAAVLATGAAAKDGDVLVAGTCTGPSDAKLKLSE